MHQACAPVGLGNTDDPQVGQQKITSCEMSESHTHHHIVRLHHQSPSSRSKNLKQSHTAVTLFFWYVRCFAEDFPVPAALNCVNVRSVNVPALTEGIHIVAHAIIG